MGSSPSKKSRIKKALPLPYHVTADQRSDQNGMEIKRGDSKSDSTDQETPCIKEAKEKQSLQTHEGKVKPVNKLRSIASDRLLNEN